MNAWQPVATVPQDGTVVLVWKKPGFRAAPICAAFWCDEAEGLVDAEMHNPVAGPTHWRPMLDGPT